VLLIEPLTIYNVNVFETDERNLEDRLMRFDEILSQVRLVLV